MVATPVSVAKSWTSIFSSSVVVTPPAFGSRPEANASFSAVKSASWRRWPGVRGSRAPSSAGAGL
ncbi:MAG TPA: hypothetical protein VIG48_05985, partial [Jatrophihabitans sp.]